MFTPLSYCFYSKGEDMESLLFHFLDDWLYKFSADLFFVPRVSILAHMSYGHQFSNLVY